MQSKYAIDDKGVKGLIIINTTSHVLLNGMWVDKKEIKYV